MENIIPYTIFMVAFALLISIGFLQMRKGWKNLRQNKGYKLINLFSLFGGSILFMWTIIVLLGFIYARILNILGYS